MTIENRIRAFAGTMILISVALAATQSVYWLFLTCFVGLNLLQSSFTRFCPLESLLRRWEQKSP